MLKFQFESDLWTKLEGPMRAGCGQTEETEPARRGDGETGKRWVCIYAIADSACRSAGLRPAEVPLRPGLLRVADPRSAYRATILSLDLTAQ